VYPIPDEGSSHLLIENNVCYDADRQPFHQHYGRENMVRNNIWMFGGEAVAIYSRLEPHRGFTWIRNIMVSNGEPIFRSDHTVKKEAGRIHSDLNLFYAVKGRPYFKVSGKKLTLKQWQALGRDKHSIVANPKFQNLNKRDLRLATDSPALKLGLSQSTFPRLVHVRPLSLAMKSEAPRGKPRGIFAEPCEAKNAIPPCGKSQGFLAKEGEYFLES